MKSEVVITNNELVMILQKRAERLLNANLSHAIENKSNLDMVQIILDELKKRLKG